MSYDVLALEALFCALPPTLSGNEQPIQNLSKFLQREAAAHAPDLAKAFVEAFWAADQPCEWLLNMLYSVNDAVQASMARAKGGPTSTPLQAALGPYIDKAVEHLFKSNPSDIVQGKLGRLAKVWEDRRCFSPAVLTSVSAVVKQFATAATTAPKPAHKNLPPAATPTQDRKASGAAAGPPSGPDAASPDLAARPLIAAYRAASEASQRAASLCQQEAQVMMHLDNRLMKQRPMDPALVAKRNDLCAKAHQALLEEVGARERLAALLDAMRKAAEAKVEQTKLRAAACFRRLQGTDAAAPRPPGQAWGGVKAAAGNYYTTGPQVSYVDEPGHVYGGGRGAGAADGELYDPDNEDAPGDVFAGPQGGFQHEADEAELRREQNEQGPGYGAEPPAKRARPGVEAEEAWAP